MIIKHRLYEMKLRPIQHTPADDFRFCDATKKFFLARVQTVGLF